MIAETDRYVVWLDLDDTLWNFHGNSLIALEETYRHFALQRFWNSVDAWRDDYHRVNERLWNELAAGKIDQPYLRRQRFFEPFILAGMDHAEAEKLTALADTFYLDRLGRLSALVPGARKLLERLRRRGFRTGILSNGFRGVQQSKLKSSGIDSLIDYVVLSDDIMVNKPDVRLFRHAEKQAGVDVAHSIMIGDNGETDIAGALNAGWEALWYNPKHRGAGPLLADALGKPSKLTVVDSLDAIDI